MKSLILVLVIFTSCSYDNTNEYVVKNFLEKEYLDYKFEGWNKEIFENIEFKIPNNLKKDTVPNTSLFYYFKSDSTRTNLIISKISIEKVTLKDYLASFKNMASIKNVELLNGDITHFEFSNYDIYICTIQYNQNNIYHIHRELVYYSENTIYSININNTFYRKITDSYNYKLDLFNRILSSLKINNERILTKTEGLKNVEIKSINDY
jgi:hypothetical protein